VRKGMESMLQSCPFFKWGVCFNDLVRQVLSDRP
jgi:hypothetical protein